MSLVVNLFLFKIKISWVRSDGTLIFKYYLEFFRIPEDCSNDWALQYQAPHIVFQHKTPATHSNLNFGRFYSSSLPQPCP